MTYRTPEPFDVVAFLQRFEAGEVIGFGEYRRGFQILIDENLTTRMGGRYTKEADRLVRIGACKSPQDLRGINNEE